MKIDPVSAAALIVPVLAGAAWMSLEGAPSSLAIANLCALGVALAVALVMPMPGHSQLATILAAVMVAVLWATALAGVETDGVRRWIAIGPVRLHVGYLVLPLLTALLAQLPDRPVALLVIAASAATALQPDRATCLGLAAAIAVIAIQRRSGILIAATVAALGFVIVVVNRADTLPPVRFVESVQADAWRMSPLAGIALLLATFTPLLLIRRSHRFAMPVAAFVVTAGIAAFVGPYPSILIGYGAAPILGFGLALAALREQS